MNADPRRPEKVQRYVPKASNGTGTEDLTPDYMNILGGQEASTDKHSEGVPSADPNHHHHHPNHLASAAAAAPQQRSEKDPSDLVVVVTTAAPAPGVVPATSSPQYGVAIITTDPGQTEPTMAPSTDSSDVVVTTKPVQEENNKDMHTTPNRNDRFKVVKIASLEPFKRGRWKCMDYVDEAPPAGTIRVPQSTGSIQIGGPYMQTQSLPQQQIQQMLLQGGFTNGTQFFATGVPTQVIPQGQFFYPTAAQNQSMPQQQQQVQTGQFITNQQAYFPVQNATGFTVPQTFPNTVQYVPANLIPNQNSAFVPTSQTVQMPPTFQQSQTYAGQANNLLQQQQQPIVNGHSFPDQTPTKNVISNSPAQVLSQQQSMQLQSGQSVPVIQNQQFQQNYQMQQQPIVAAVQLQQQQQPTQQQQLQQLQAQQSVDQGNNANANNVVYTNPTFAMSVNSLTVLESGEGSQTTESSSEQAEQGENTDDPAKTNPVVNAIDNKIEQAMDLVKSHLMYTVREEVEVLKEKIAELMERIQQLETENNFLRSQIPKSQQQMPAQATVTAPVTATVTQPQTLTAAASPTPAAASETTQQQQ